MADTRLGDGSAEALHRYWTIGAGRARWNTWTELYEHLPTERAKRTAAEWFHEVMGFWPGADANRVRQGKPPAVPKSDPADHQKILRERSSLRQEGHLLPIPGSLKGLMVSMRSGSPSQRLVTPSSLACKYPAGICCTLPGLTGRSSV